MALRVLTHDLYSISGELSLSAMATWLSRLFRFY
jgi:hypothetical protein